jgi:hypothetical protein
MQLLPRQPRMPCVCLGVDFLIRSLTLEIQPSALDSLLWKAGRCWMRGGTSQRVDPSLRFAFSLIARTGKNHQETV